ncbi:gamma-glutamyltransferase [Puniceicoccales bacterium CK1056]|uniref:Glutathione hydrolase proenzyme n=1 Tax=Oceanipulchritudo coccoides TaxID=2706888 RepID=A0A6B2LZN1_9BACT|nr:gamma-glutamyltransferase [Oceanipulchritudo coccoides]NDV61509.1 gamma-glutamyltransferase [Oceanipulchritudo coccoides]
MADRISGKAFATRSEVLAQHGMVASSQPIATQVGLQILREGGSAMDAAIAVNACLGLMEPTGCGIGGDLFAIVWDAKSQSLHGLNGSGRSARSASLDDMRSALGKTGQEHIPMLGPLSVSVPGCVDGWFTLHEKFGHLPFERVLAPAIEYAESGFPVSEVIAYYWNKSIELRASFPGFLDTFTVDGERAPAKGEVWRNPALAETYRLLAREGRDGFYTGKLAREMAGFLEASGSFLREEDFAGHRSEWVDPISTNYRGYDIWELPPNGQGLAALQMLNILEGYDLAGMGFGSAEFVHLFVEAKKQAFADRARCYADPHFFDVPLERLLSKEYAASQRRQIMMDKAAPSVIPDPEVLKRGDTVYFCTADSEGNMVSFIQSNYWGIGSGLCPPGLGFGFQNRGASFALDPSHANVYAPGKRPFHTIIPAFITREGKPLCAFGVMGGDTQPQAHAQIVCHLVDFKLGLQEAGDAPRVVHSGDSNPRGGLMENGGIVVLETGFSPEVIDSLKDRGHCLEAGSGQFGGYQAIWRNPETGVYAGASESRKDGQAAGY